ncbi:MAG: bifunctional oligoribonuclease/PAP phosphatase NrnA [Deltaproteobacteria bacterium]|nr:bifunctional oligoribonuclease/PAP phosphatase NrnA [Deltaproteobacteria bacterium]
MIEQIAEIINKHDNFLVITHVNPDGDAIGSLLGMYLALREMGKTAAPVLGTKFPALFEFLPGKDDVLIGLESINFDPTYIISLDVAAENRISPQVDALRETATLINVDHHPTNPGYGNINHIQRHANSTTQLVYEILEKAGHPLSIDVGKCLYTGLITDTGCFKFAGVTSKTFELAAKLLEPGVDNYEITRYLFEEFAVSRLALEKLMLERLEILLDGKLVLSHLDLEDFEEIGADLSEGENLVNRLRETRGVEVGGLITKLSDNLCKVSLRSKGLIDVSAIASELGGGGHRRAAGIKASMSPQKLRIRLLELISTALSQSQK